MTSTPDTARSGEPDTLARFAPLGGTDTWAAPVLDNRAEVARFVRHDAIDSEPYQRTHLLRVINGPHQVPHPRPGRTAGVDRVAPLDLLTQERALGLQADHRLAPQGEACLDRLVQLHTRRPVAYPDDLRPFHIMDHLHPLVRGVLPALRCVEEPGHNGLVRRQEHDLGEGVVWAEDLYRLL